MHRLNLLQFDIINLIRDITKSSLRITALTLNVNTIEEFLKKMHQITDDISE